MTVLNNYFTSKIFYSFDINRGKAECLTTYFKAKVEEKAIYLTCFGVSITMITRTPTEKVRQVGIIHKGHRNQ
jgi:hypothetical protein